MEFDKKLFEQVCRDYVLNTISRSKYLRVKLPLLEHAKIYEWTKNKASHEQIISLILSEGSNKQVTKEAIKEFEGACKTILEGIFTKKYPFQGTGKGIARAGKAAWTIGNIKLGTTLAAAVIGYYLYKKLSDPCIRQCKLNRECIKDCRITAINKTIDSLQSQLPNCQNTSDPEKCVNRIRKEISKWNDKLRDLQSKG